jgi:hypothetical protein
MLLGRCAGILNEASSPDSLSLGGAPVEVESAASNTGPLQTSYFPRKSTGAATLAHPIAMTSITEWLTPGLAWPDSICQILFHSKAMPILQKQKCEATLGLARSTGLELRFSPVLKLRCVA